MWKKVFLGHLIIAWIAVASLQASYRLIDTEHSNVWNAFLVFCFIFLITALISALLARNITGNLAILASAARRIAERQLYHRIELPRVWLGDDETYDVAMAINHMLDELRTLTVGIEQSGKELAEAAQQLRNAVAQATLAAKDFSDSTETIALGAEHQQHRMKQTSEAINRMSRSLGKTADAAREGARSSVAISEAVTGGAKNAQDAVKLIRDVFATIERSAAKVVQFGVKSRQIDKISGVISHISRQTNLLALNAAIEAARTSNEGKGFAVVGDEIRKLAESTSKSAAQIGGLVEEIGQESAAALHALDEGTMQLAEGREGLSQMIRTLEQVTEKVRLSAKIIEPIAMDVQQQLQDADFATGAMDDVSSVAERNVEATKRSRAAAEKQMQNIELINRAADNLLNISKKLEAAAESFRKV